METNYITIKTFGNAVEAELFRIELKSVDIESIISDDYMISTNPFLAFALGGVKVKIAETDIKNVQELFPNLDEIEEYSGTIHEELYKDIKEWFYHKSIRNIFLISISYILIALMVTFTFKFQSKVYTENINHHKVNSNSHLPIKK
jgi:hypothetical protein